METNYRKQAEDFLKETGTTFEAKFIGNMPYFDDDKESRDIYQITLTRGKCIYSFRFGQSIEASKPARDKKRENKEYEDGRMLFKKFSPQFFQAAPTPYDVLACVTKNDPGTFSDFCSDFGYDTDSRKAEKTYFAVQEEYKGVHNLFFDVMEKLQEIN